MTTSRAPDTTGRVLEAVGGAYAVAVAEETVTASLRGRIKHAGGAEDRVVVGDRVVMRLDSGGWVIEDVRRRRSVLSRWTADGRVAKVMAANLDRLLVVASVGDPRPSQDVVDRMLVMGESGGLAVVLVLTKADLPGTTSRRRRFARFYESVGYPVLSTSVTTGEGMDAFGRLVRSGSSALVGPSGVGKSSLLNWLEPSLSLRTLTVGTRSRAGRHATVSSRLVSLPGGGHVADLPGFSAVGPGCPSPAGLDRCFPDFRPFLSGCAFRDCRHVQEPGCAIARAVDDGKVQRSRHRAYLAILAEAGGRERPGQ